MSAPNKAKAKAGKGKGTQQHAAPVTDPRFARLHTDPRFVKPKRDQAKVAVDERFKDIFDASKMNAAAGAKVKVDKFGRKKGKEERQREVEEMKRLYRLEGDEDEGDEDSEENEEQEEGADRPVDYARGEGLLESSGDEDSDEDDGDDDDEDSSDDGEAIVLGTAAVRRREAKKAAAAQQYEDEEDDDEDDDDDEGPIVGIDGEELDPRALAELDAQAKANIVANLGASASTSKAASKSERKARKEAKTIEPGEETNRVAIVNMDWDHVRAKDLFAVFASLVSPAATVLPVDAIRARTEEAKRRAAKGADDEDEDDSLRRGKSATSQVQGRVERIRVYPSEFGRERMAREDVEGPPREIFKTDKTAAEGAAAAKARLRKAKAKAKAREEREEDSGFGFEVDDGGEFDEEALRRYQLERLRYYYAIATFDSAETARWVYGEIDGTEFERTANIFDLRFVPDGMDFPEHEGGDDGWRDEATENSSLAGYKGVDFKTDALRHSRVKLTWDADDAERQKVTRLASRGALTKDQLRDDDFKAYLASASEDEVSDAEGGAGGEAERARVRALLGLDGSGDLNGDGLGKARSRAFADARKVGAEDEQGEMEITFMPGLSEAAARKAKQGPGKGGKAEDKEESTIEKYMRKQREKKMKRKEGKGEETPDDAEPEAAEADGTGFNDPFFAGGDDEDGDVDIDELLAKEKASAKGKKEKVKPAKEGAKAAVDEDDEAAQARARAELELMLDSDSDGEGGARRHFDMKDVIKAERGKDVKDRARGKRGKKNKKKAEAEEAMAGKSGKKAGDGFEIDVKDDRFKAVMEDHRFALDPSHPSFVKTKAMERILEERRKRQHDKGGEAARRAQKPMDEGTMSKGGNAASTAGAAQAKEGDSLKDLVSSLKKRGAPNAQSRGPPAKKVKNKQ